jgi:hypothetical protein
MNLQDSPLHFDPTLIHVAKEIEFLEAMKSVAKMRFHPTIAWIMCMICAYYLRNLISLRQMGIWYVSTVKIDDWGVK